MSGASNSSSDNASSSSIPKLPHDRALFGQWRMVMHAYLNVKGVWSVVCAGDGDGVSSTAGSSTKSVSKGKEDTDVETSVSSPSTGQEEPDVGKLKKLAWLILLQACSKPTHFDHAQQADGDPAALWKRLVSSYGIVKTAETMAALHAQLAFIRITRKELMDEYIARCDKLFADLKYAGNDIHKAQRKLYILQGLCDCPEWQTTVEFIRKIDKDDVWSNDEFDQALISDDKARRLRQGTINKAHENAHFTQNHRGRGGRGNGNWRGRGRGNHARNDNHNDHDNNDGVRQNDGAHRGNNRGRGGFRGNNRGNHNNNNNSNNDNNYYDKSHIQCYKCLVYGHVKRDCPEWKKHDNALKTDGDNGVALMVRTMDKAVTPLYKHAYAHHATLLSEYAHMSRMATNEFVFDSAATSHFSGYKHIMFDITTIDSPISVYTGNAVSTYNTVGKISFRAEGKTYTLHDVAYVPGFNVNLVSVSKMMDKGIKVTCDPVTNTKILSKKDTVTKEDMVLFSVPRKGNLFILSTDVAYTASDIVDISRIDNIKHSDDLDRPTDAAVDVGVTVQSDEVVKKELRRLHVLLGHQSYTQLHKLIKKDSVDGLTSIMKKVNSKMIRELIHEQCDGCVKGKLIRLPMTGKIDYKADSEMAVWCGDVIGPIKGMSLVGNEYVLNQVDVCKARMFVDVIKHKSDVKVLVKKRINQQQTKTMLKLKTYHTDGGGEFVNDELDSFFAENGTVHTKTTAHTSQHNPAERGNRTLIEMARAIMHYSGVPRYVGDEAIMMAAVLLDVRISSVDDAKTPFELYEKRKPKLSKLHVFGCDVYRYNHPSDRDGKLDETGKRGIFVGYEPTNGSYFRVLDMEQMKVIVSRDVKFFDDKFDNAKLLKARERREMDGLDDYEPLQYVDIGVDDYVNDDVDIEALFEGESVAANNANTNDKDAIEHIKDATEHNKDAKEHIKSNDNSSQSLIEQRVGTDVNSVNNETTIDKVVEKNNDKREERAKRDRVPVKLFEPDDFRVKNKRVDTALITNDNEPQTFKQALASAEADQWRAAIKDEINSQLQNGTWVEVMRKSGMNLIGTKWVFTKKKDENGKKDVNGKAVKFKARLVAKGYNQEYGIDYSETFAPVLKYKSFRLMLAIATLFDLEVEQLDVKTAFLNADLEETVYIEVPDGVSVSKNKVLKLKKALYGLKQAPKAWNDNIDAFLRSVGFNPCIKDPCIYVKKSKSKTGMVLGLYVDDIMPMYHRRDRDEWNQFKQVLMNKYQVSDLGRVSNILKMKVMMDKDKLYINQQEYVNEKLIEYNMSECAMTDTPEASGVKLVEAADDDKLNENDVSLLRSIVGSLQYASVSTRPDITHAVNKVARFMAKGGRQHVIAAKRILRYLQGTQHLGLVYQKDEKMVIEGGQKVLTVTGYCDSDWGGDLVDRKSTTGYCVFVNNNLVSWNTKKQTTVATSSAEAEVMAAAAVVSEIMWLKMILGELGFMVKTPITVYCDNQSAISITTKDVKHERTKHIDIKYHFVHDEIVSNNIEMKYVSTKDQLADIFTKGLGATAFVKLRDQLMNQQ
jgi:hypothetical protein